MPQANSSPVSALSRAKAQAAASETALPHSRRPLPESSADLNSPPSASTAPRRPSSGTSRFEPLPSAKYGTAAALSAASAAESEAASAMRRKRSAGPPILKLVCALMRSSLRKGIPARVRAASKTA